MMNRRKRIGFVVDSHSVHAPAVFSRYYGLAKRRLTVFLLCLGLFPYKFYGKSLKGVSTSLVSSLIVLRLDLLRGVSPVLDCQIVPSNTRTIIITRMKPSPPLG